MGLFIRISQPAGNLIDLDVLRVCRKGKRYDPVVKHDGVVYHFYCAVNNAEQRGIAIATSKPMGRSAVRFPKPEIKNRRQIIELNEGWKTWRVENGKLRVESEKTGFSELPVFETELKTRAFENQLFLAACNRSGQEGEYTFFGHSMLLALPPPWEI